jgi:methionine synthase II (cobalamin-independent)
VIIFFDEPALAGFGSSEFISMSREEVMACFEEVLGAAAAEGGITGIHVCANSDWSLILDSSANIVSFDAYSYFDKFMLYPDHVRRFIEKGNIIAWGIVPTGDVKDIERETADSLVAQWKEKAAQMETLGLDSPVVMTHSLITPSCGTGSLSLEHATRVLELTKAVSERLREKIG